MIRVPFSSIRYCVSYEYILAANGAEHGIVAVYYADRHTASDALGCAVWRVARVLHRYAAHQPRRIVHLVNKARDLARRSGLPFSSYAYDGRSRSPELELEQLFSW